MHPPELPGFTATTSLSAISTGLACPSREPSWKANPPPARLPLLRLTSFVACRCHYPGGTVKCLHRSLPSRRRPSRNSETVGFRTIRFEACSAFTCVSACNFAKSPKATLTPETQAASSPPPPLQLLPAGTTPAGQDLHLQNIKHLFKAYPDCQ